MREGEARDMETDTQGTRGRQDGNGEVRRRDGKQLPHPTPTMDNHHPSPALRALLVGWMVGGRMTGRAGKRQGRQGGKTRGKGDERRAGET
jgi:hypothetical protein